MTVEKQAVCEVRSRGGAPTRGAGGFSIIIFRGDSEYILATQESHFREAIVEGDGLLRGMGFLDFLVS